MKTTRILSLLTAAALCLSLAACAGGKTAAKDPAELADAYAQAITAARDQESNDVHPVMTNGDDIAPEELEMYFSVLGIAPEDVSAYGLSLSLMNVQAYAVAAILPAQGREDAVKDGLEGYVENQKNSFANYLEDQYAIASSAKVETLEDGTVLLVMCQDQDAVADSIKAALAG